MARDEKERFVHINGGFQCEANEGWREGLDSKLQETHDMMNSLIEHTSHLPKLTKIADSIATIQDKLLESATGKDHINTKTVILLLKIFGAVVVGLTVVIVYLLTGLHLGLINSLH